MRREGAHPQSLFPTLSRIRAATEGMICPSSLDVFLLAKLSLDAEPAKIGDAFAVKFAARAKILR
jgi:hypothetical protein